MTCVRDLAGIRLTDDETVGGKGANLGELISAGFPVPGGFVVSRDGYWAARSGEAAARSSRSRWTTPPRC